MNNDLLNHTENDFFLVCDLLIDCLIISVV